MMGEIEKSIYRVEYTSNIVLDDKEIINIINTINSYLSYKDDFSHKELLKINYLLGIANARLGNNEKSIEYINKIINSTEVIKNEYYVAKSYGWNAVNYLALRNFEEYKKNYIIAENRLRYLKQYEDLALLSNKIACNLFRGEYPKEDIRDMLYISEEYLKKVDSKLSGDCYTNIGEIYSIKFNDFDAALYNYTKALEYAKKYNNIHTEVTVLYQIGVGYYQLGLKDEAIEIYNKILEESKFNEYYLIQASAAMDLIKRSIEKPCNKNKIKKYISKCEECIKKIGKSKKEQYEIQLELLKISYEVNIEKKDMDLNLKRLRNLEKKYIQYRGKFIFTHMDYDIEELYGIIYFTQNKLYSAMKHHKIMRSIANKYQITYLIKAYTYLAHDYEVLKDYKKAYSYIVKANKAIVEIEHSELIKKYIKVYKNYEKIRDNEKEKDNFLATLSHELKTPINIIYSTMQLLNLFKAKNDGEFKNYYFKYEKSLRLNCLRMIRLVNNIIDLTKLDSGMLQANLINYDIVKLAREIITSVLSYVEINDINLEFNSQIEQAIISCDPSMIERILLNLLSNSIKYSKEKGNISVKIYLEESFVVIEVADDGIGIPLKMQKKIFDKFFQVDKSLNRKKEGSGIGLSLVKMLVEAQRGHISLKSEENVGSTFKIFLPNSVNKTMEYTYIDEHYNISLERVNAELSDIYEIV